MRDWEVICLCADWCGVCRQWTPLFEALAADHPHARFAWIDVEDEDEAMGDVEIETFPTLLVARGGQVVFLGPVQPLATQVTRLLAGLQAQAQPAAGLPAGAQALYARLAAGPLARRTV